MDIGLPLALPLPFVRSPRPQSSPAVNLFAVVFKCGRVDHLLLTHYSSTSGGQSVCLLGKMGFN